MTMHEASRTLVKSTPELWAECSQGESLARHLGAFGEIRITKLEPETAVAWEGDEVRGTVTLEPSGWGTRVVLTATPEPGGEPEAGAEPVAEPEPVAMAVPDAEPQPPPESELRPEPEPRVESEPRPESEPAALAGFFTRLLGRLRGLRPERKPLGEGDPLIDLTGGGAAEPPQPAGEPAAASPDPPEPPPAPSPPAPELEALVGALDSLGTPHRRPFSRS